MMDKNTYQRQEILLFDEMQVQESITLINVRKIKLTGIQDFSDNNIATSKTADTKANHALVFMFSSLADSFTQPVAVQAAKGPTKRTCLSHLIIQVINQLEKSGAIIEGLVCDGATTNRKMWSEFGISGRIEEPVNKIVHPFDEQRYLPFFLMHHT